MSEQNSNSRNDGKPMLGEGYGSSAETWTTFLRKNGRWSLWHLCTKDGKCKCGWEYTPDEYTHTKVALQMPGFAVCDFCARGITDEGQIRTSVE